MATSLMNNFKSKMSKLKDPNAGNTAEFDVLYSTGFLSIDYLNGTVVHVESEDRNFVYHATGIVDGSTNTIIGRSGSGKSTLMMQIIGNIMRPFIEQYNKDGDVKACIYIDDLEASLPFARKEFLIGISRDKWEECVDMRNTGITAENIYKRIYAIYNDKLSNKSNYTYDTGLYDTNGDRIFKLIPTVYAIDSIPQIMPENIIEDEDLGGGMDASAVAKTNTFLFKKISQLCKAANIILITINHILDEISTGFIPKAAQISGLKQGERLPGGKAALYLANNMFRVDDSITLKPDKDYGIDGSVVTFTIIKSRTNTSKKSIPLIFNKTVGEFDKELSLYHLLKEEGKIKGAGVAQFLDECPDVKFSTKTFKKVLYESTELQEVFAKECFNILSTYLSETRKVDANANAVSNNIAGMFNKFMTAKTE